MYSPKILLAALTPNDLAVQANRELRAMNHRYTVLGHTAFYERIPRTIEGGLYLHVVMLCCVNRCRTDSACGTYSLWPFTGETLSEAERHKTRWYHLVEPIYAIVNRSTYFGIADGPWHRVVISYRPLET